MVTLHLCWVPVKLRELVPLCSMNLQYLTRITFFRRIPRISSAGRHGYLRRRARIFCTILHGLSAWYHAEESRQKFRADSCGKWRKSLVSWSRLWSWASSVTASKVYVSIEKVAWMRVTNGWPLDRASAVAWLQGFNNRYPSSVKYVRFLVHPRTIVQIHGRSAHCCSDDPCIATQTIRALPCWRSTYCCAGASGLPCSYLRKPKGKLSASSTVGGRSNPEEGLAQ